MFHQTIQRIADLPVLILLTHRPDYEAPWVGEANVAQIVLSRLDAQQSRMLADGVSGTPLDPTLMEQVVARSDGVPLFLEELTKTLVDARHGGAAQQGAPIELPFPGRARLTHRSLRTERSHCSAPRRPTAASWGIGMDHARRRDAQV